MYHPIKSVTVCFASVNDMPDPGAALDEPTRAAPPLTSETSPTVFNMMPLGLNDSPLVTLFVPEMGI